MSFDLMALAHGTNIEKSPSQKLILLIVASNSNSDGYSWWSVEKMAKFCSMSKRCFQENLAALERLKYIIKRPRKNKTTVYKMNRKKMLKNQIKDEEINAKKLVLASGINATENHGEWGFQQTSACVQVVYKKPRGADSAPPEVQNLHPNQLVNQSIRSLTTSNAEKVDNSTEKTEPELKAPKYQKPPAQKPAPVKNMSAPTAKPPITRSHPAPTHRPQPDLNVTQIDPNYKRDQAVDEKWLNGLHGLFGPTIKTSDSEGD